MSDETSSAPDTASEAPAPAPVPSKPAPTRMNRALDRSDDVGAVMASFIGLAGIFDVPAQLGITADELAMALGFGFTIMAFVRGRLERRRRDA